MLGGNHSNGPLSPRCSIQLPKILMGCRFLLWSRNEADETPFSFPSISISSFQDHVELSSGTRLKLLQITSSAMQWNYLVRWTAPFCSLTSNEDRGNLAIRNPETVKFWFSRSSDRSLSCTRLRRQLFDVVFICSLKIESTRTFFVVLFLMKSNSDWYLAMANRKMLEDISSS